MGQLVSTLQAQLNGMLRTWFPNREYKIVMGTPRSVRRCAAHCQRRHWSPTPRLPPAPPAVGLDNAGKTTILYRLHLGEAVRTVPTIGSNVEQVGTRAPAPTPPCWPAAAPNEAASQGWHR